MALERTFQVHEVRNSNIQVSVSAAIEYRETTGWTLLIQFLPKGGAPVKWSLPAGLLLSAFEDDGAMNEEVAIVTNRGRTPGLNFTFFGVKEKTTERCIATFTFPYRPLRSLAALAQEAGCQPFDYESAIDTLITRILSGQ